MDSYPARHGNPKLETNSESSGNWHLRTIVDSFKSYEGRVRWYPNPGSMVLFAILFRILLIPTELKVLGAPNDHFKYNEPSHIAAHLVHGDGFASPYTSLAIPTAQQPPLYPLFVAGVFAVFGVFSNLSLYALLIANAVAGALTAWFVYRIGTKYFSPSVGSLAGWGWALLATVADLGFGAYALAALAVALWLHYVPDLAPNVRNWFLLGALTGVMLLLNPMLVWLIPASAFWFTRKQTLVLAGSALLILAPWYVRNYLVMKHIYPGLRDNLGLELYLGNHAGMSGTYDYWHPDSPYSAEMPKLGEAQFFAIRQKRALAFIRAEPWGFLTRSCQRVAEFWLRPWPILYILLLGLAALGFRAFPRPLRFFTAILFLFYPLVFYITQVSWPTNYRHPIEPLILLMVSVTVCRYRSSVVSQSQPRTG